MSRLEEDKSESRVGHATFYFLFSTRQEHRGYRDKNVFLIWRSSFEG